MELVFEKKIHIFLLMCIVGIFGMILTSNVAEAQSDCCVQNVYKLKRITKSTGFLGLNKQTFESLPEKGSNLEQGCYIREANVQCKTAKVRTEEKCFGGVGGEDKICTYEEVFEEEVACDAFPVCFAQLDQEAQCDNLNVGSCRKSRACFWDKTTCQSRFKAGLCSRLSADFCGTENGSQACTWNKEIGACITKLEAQLGANRTSHSDILPPCAIQGNCRNLNDLVQVAINVAKKLFGLIGSAAFLMFIYGGVVMIASFGNSERFEQGKQILSAAIIGIVIAFGAFLLIGYVLNIIGVDSDLRANVNVGTE